MATRTFCDICGDESPCTTEKLPDGDVDMCAPCKVEHDTVVRAWVAGKLKTKKKFEEVVDAKTPVAP